MIPDNGAVALIDKPPGMTSHDVVARMRRVFGTRRVGHAGTLDPMATGLLIIAVNRATRLIQFLSGLDKTYEAEATLGAESDTCDAEGEIRPTAGAAALPGEIAVRDALESFRGEIEQTPPAYSAIKIQGRRAYEMARKGKPVEMKPRRIRIEWIEMRGFDSPRLRFDCRVSSGTYIRSIARDLGRNLGCGAYLSELRRTSIGSFEIGRAEPLETWERSDPTSLDALLDPADALPHLQRLTIDSETRRRLEHGQSVPLDRDLEPDAEFAAAIAPDGRLAAICRLDRDHGLARPVCVFPRD